MALGVAALAVGVRLFAGEARLGGRSGAWWASAALLAVVGSRLGWGARDVAARRMSWTRLLLPALIAVELTLLVVGRTSRGAMLRLLLAVEVALVATTIAVVWLRGRRQTVAAREWDERFEQTLGGFVAPALARVLAAELAIVGAALSAPFARKQATTATTGEYGYMRGSPLNWMPIFVVLAMPADLMLVQALIPARLAWLRWLLDGSGLYALVWIVGMGVTMRRRPHRLRDGQLELRRGVLRRARVPVGAIAAVEIVAPIDSRGALRRLGSDAWFAWPRQPLLEVRLRAPVAVQRALGGDGVTARLLIAADEPESLRRALLAAVAEAAAVAPGVGAAG